MAKKAKQVKVQCPIEECNKKAKIEVPKYLLDKKKFGTLKIQVHQGVCCEHEFIAFIDRNGKVRGYEQIDMSINLDKFLQEQEGGEEKIYLNNLVKKYGVYATSNMLRALMLDLNIYLILKGGESIKFPMMVNSLLKSFLPEGYKKELIIFSIQEEEYENTEIKNALAITPSGNVSDNPWKEGSYENEKNIINRGLYILDQDAQHIIVENEIKKLFNRAQYIKEVIMDIDEIYEDELKSKIKEKFNTGEVSDEDIMLLKQICNYRFDGPTDKIKIRSFSKLKEGLW